VDSEPLIDVVIPNRNKATFLPATLACLKAQTEQRWRAIAIDNESDDGSWEILSRFCDGDNRVELQSMPPPARTGFSVYRTWNAGLLTVRAPFFAILTSDDLWPDDFLQRMLNNLSQFPTAVACASRVECVDENGREVGKSEFNRVWEESLTGPMNQPILVSAAGGALRSYLIGPSFHTIHALMFRSTLIEDGHLFTEDTGGIADVEYYLQTCLRGAVVYDPRLSVSFRFSAAQISGNVDGRDLNSLWAKIMSRNTSRVAQVTGIPRHVLNKAQDKVLRRHRFLMQKSNLATWKQNKLAALAQMARAALLMPGECIAFLFAKGSKRRYLMEWTRNVAKSILSDAAIN
jgi:glycosyltransferase involved in cell wall biosynthesis